jgi:hypothetical protein
MREIRTSGSEGGGAEANRPSLPLSVIPASGQGRGFAILLGCGVLDGPLSRAMSASESSVCQQGGSPCHVKSPHM